MGFSMDDLNHIVDLIANIDAASMDFDLIVQVYGKTETAGEVTLIGQIQKVGGEYKFFPKTSDYSL